MLKRIGAAICILLGACGDGQAREVIYGYYTPLFETEDPKPPPIHYPLFPPEIWQLILQDLSAADLANVAKVCRGLEKVTWRFDQAYLPKLAYQSRDLGFFKYYMLTPIFGLKPSLSPLQDLYTIFGSYKAIYDSGYMVDVFIPEHVKEHKKAIAKIAHDTRQAKSYRDADTYEQDKQQRALIKEALKAAKTFIFPFRYTDWPGQTQSIITLCQKYTTDHYFEGSFYYPLSAKGALWDNKLYINNDYLLKLLSQAPVKPQILSLRVNGPLITQPPIWLSQMTTLTKLDIWWGDLSDLPIQLSKLQDLVSLNLSDKFAHIPPVISTFTNLCSLRLSHSSIKNFTAEIEKLSCLTNLSRLGFYRNQITDINFLSKLTYLSKLENIDLSANKIRSIPDWIMSWRGLQDKKLTIDLQDNPLNGLWGPFLQSLIGWRSSFPRQERPEYNTNPQVKIITD